jgi:membrane protease YdiL (CAAX protease family)
VQGPEHRWQVDELLGLRPYHSFGCDGWFVAALLAGVMFWGLLWLSTPVLPLTGRQVLAWRFFFLALWQPGWEELLFRGVLQGYVRQYAWGRRGWYGLTGANVLVSVLFVLGHFVTHPPWWALAVLGPSLLFGWMRDHYGTVYPAMVLHAWYNAGYFWLTGFPAG